MYEYRCTVTRVVDGDTVDVVTDVGFRILIGMRFRLAGINAPEMNTPAGPASKARLAELMPVGHIFVVRTRKDKQEKYGRYLGTFVDLEEHEVNSRMILEGFAVPFMV